MSPLVQLSELTFPEAARRIEVRDPELRAFVSTRLEHARREHEARRGEAPRSPLHGVPYSLKDLWDTAGITTTGGSHRFRDRVPEASAPIHRVLDDAGAILLGKTNASDLGLAIESQSYVAGVTRNPHDPSRTAGGSSGGAAAAVADGMSAFDWGSDFGGSIRIPAAYCGIHGLRLSSEAWPVEGHFPMAPDSLRSMVGQGPMTRRLPLMRALLDLARPSLRTGTARRFELRGVQLYEPEGAYAGEWPSFGADVAGPLADAAGELRRDHGLPDLGRAFRIACAMYASHLEDFLDSDPSLSFAAGLRSVLGAIAFQGRLGGRTFHPRTAEMLLLIALGRATLYRNAAAAERAAAQYRADVAAVWDRGYLLALPTVAYPAPRHGRTLLKWRLPAAAMPGNVADATALALPFGTFPSGHPRSLQLWGPPGSEAVVLDVAERLAR